MMLSLSANLLAGGMLLFTILFYAVFYSMWLKRSTPQNIVIGGAAGAFPPVIGWIIATGSFSVEAWLMFALIFMWTPPHFWALALFMRYDIWQRDEDISETDNYLTERKFFKLSLLYLFLHFGAILLEAALKPWGLGGWS